MSDNKQEVLSGGNFRCTYYKEDQYIVPQRDCRFLMLFALGGSIDFEFATCRQRVSAEHIVVVDSHAVLSYSCDPNTIVLEYMPLDKLSGYFAVCSRVFRLPMSTVLPISPSVREWIDDLLAVLMSKTVHPDEFYLTYYQSLQERLLLYPRNILGELYIALYANYITDGKDKVKKNNDK